MQLVQQGNVNKLLMPVVMATLGKAMSELEKSRDEETTKTTTKSDTDALQGALAPANTSVQQDTHTEGRL